MTQEEILQLINTVVAANAESQKEFARELAQQIANPPKTEEELKAQKVLWEARCEAASMDEAARARKRDFCVPSMTDRPHRRPMNIFQGLHAGQSVIVWKMTQYSSRDPETKQTLQIGLLRPVHDRPATSQAHEYLSGFARWTVSHRMEDDAIQFPRPGNQADTSQ